MAAVAATLNELRRIVTELVPPDELARVRSWYLYELEFGFDSCYDMQVRFGWGEVVGVVWPPEEEQREVLAVGRENLREVARILFAPGNLNLVAVGPLTPPLKKQVRELVAEYERWYRNELQGNEA